MNKAPRYWSAPIWAWMVVIGVVSLFGRLSFWQYERGQARALANTEQQRAQQMRPIVTNSDDWLQLKQIQQGWRGQNIEVTGEAKGEWQILLDGHSNGAGRPGVQVLLPILLKSGVVVMVNRGWLPTETMRLPKGLDFPKGQTTWRGQWHAIARPAVGVGSPCPTQSVQFPWRALYPSREVLQCVMQQHNHLPHTVADGVLLLDPSASSGFARNWQTFLLPPERHYGYAVQWALLALTCVVLFIVLNIKRAKK